MGSLFDIDDGDTFFVTNCKLVVEGWYKSAVIEVNFANGEALAFDFDYKKDAPFVVVEYRRRGDEWVEFEHRVFNKWSEYNLVPRGSAIEDPRDLVAAEKVEADS